MLKPRARVLECGRADARRKPASKLPLSRASKGTPSKGSPPACKTSITPRLATHHSFHHRLKIARAMQHPPDLQTLTARRIKNEIAAKALNPPRPQSRMCKFRPRATNLGILRKKLKGIVGSLQKPASDRLIVLPNITIDGLQIAEHILTLIVSHGNQAAAIMR